jgi:hypothetical protein
MCAENKYAGTIKDLTKRARFQLDKIEASTFSIKESPLKWSRKEILGHLIDSANNNYRRFLLAQLQDDLIFEGYDQEAWVQLNNYQEWSIDSLIETFTILNLHIAKLLELIPEELLKKTTQHHNFNMICMKPVYKENETNLAYLVEDYIFHLKHHLNQIDII